MREPSAAAVAEGSVCETELAKDAPARLFGAVDLGGVDPGHAIEQRAPSLEEPKVC